jgi:hypothetical protein
VSQQGKDPYSIVVLHILFVIRTERLLDESGIPIHPPRQSKASLEVVDTQSAAWPGCLHCSDMVINEVTDAEGETTSSLGSESQSEGPAKGEGEDDVDSESLEEDEDLGGDKVQL